MMRFLAVLPVVLMVAGCGRAGPVQPPGPADRITYPRAYPRPERPSTPPATAPGATSGIVTQEPLAAPR